MGIRTAACLALLIGAMAGGCGEDDDRKTATSSVLHADPAGTVFDDARLDDFSLTMDPSDWAGIVDNEGLEWRRASLQWRTETVDPIGVRPAGGSRFAGDPKMSVDLQFDAFVPDQRFHGLKKLRLNGNGGSHDPSFIRNRLSFDIFRAHMAASRTVHCRLLVNGDYRGLYLAVESVDDVMVTQRFGRQLGNLYSANGYSTDSFLWIGPQVSNYVPEPWFPVTTGGFVDDQPVVNFIDVLNNSPADFGSVCDLDSLIDYLACEAAVTDTDGLDGGIGVNNIYQYYRLDNGRFISIPWDLESTWDNDPARDIFTNFQDTMLSAIVENDPVLRARFKAKIGEILDTDLAAANILARINFIYNQIRDAVYADPNKPMTNEQFDDQVGYIREFAPLRAESLRSQIAQP